LTIRGSDSIKGKSVSLLPHVQTVFRGTSLLLNGYRNSFPGGGGGVGKPRRGVELNTPPSSVEVNDDRNYTSAPSICHRDVDKDSFTFTFCKTFYVCVWLCYFNTFASKCCYLGRFLCYSHFISGLAVRRVSCQKHAATPKTGLDMACSRTHLILLLSDCNCISCRFLIFSAHFQFCLYSVYHIT
jgi:hypothetical protein